MGGICAALVCAAALDDVTASTAVDLAPIEGSAFSRGDANQNGAIEIADAISALGVLFASDETSCLAALDANGDAGIDIADPIFLLEYLFAGGATPAPPGPGACGPARGDPGCAEHRPCAEIRLLYEARVRNLGPDGIAPPIRIVLDGAEPEGIEPANAHGVVDGKAYWEVADGEELSAGESSLPIDLAFRGEEIPILSFRIFARSRSCALYSLRVPAVTRLPERIGIYRLREGSLLPLGTVVTAGEGSPVGPPSILASSEEILAVAHGATMGLEVFRFIGHEGIEPIAPPVRLAGGPATALAVDPSGEIAVAGGGGTIEIFRPDPSMPRIARFDLPDPVRALAVAARILFAAAGGGIARARGIEERWDLLEPYPLPEGAAPEAFAWAGPTLLALDPAKGIFVLRADLASGGLSLVPGSPFTLPERPGAFATARAEFVYAAGQAHIFALRLLSSGSLATLGRRPIPEGVIGLAADCRGDHLYGVSPRTRTLLAWRIAEDGTIAEAGSIRDSHPDYVPGPFAIR